MLLHIKQARYVADYKVEVTFSDGRRGIADLSEALFGPVFEPLLQKSSFPKLRLDQDAGTIVWPNGADLAPEYIYSVTQFKSKLASGNHFLNSVVRGKKAFFIGDEDELRKVGGVRLAQAGTHQPR